uniref:Uncharacterized protein n=1 Tax=Brassica oleracea TaxID=3712 RepID=A0A3P6GZX5_BRAOL|nr:unnamed protein product [Brassica oleracea]
MKWISGDGEGEDEIHTIVLKKSVDEITRSVLVERATDTEAIDTEATETEGGDEEGTEKDATDNEGTGGVLTLYEDIEMHENVTEREAGPSVEVTPVVYKEWDDGMDLVLDQEFRTKEEAQTHIQAASHLMCFEYEVIKSDTKR